MKISDGSTNHVRTFWDLNNSEKLRQLHRSDQTGMEKREKREKGKKEREKGGTLMADREGLARLIPK